MAGCLASRRNVYCCIFVIFMDLLFLCRLLDPPFYWCKKNRFEENYAYFYFEIDNICEILKESTHSKKDGKNKVFFQLILK